MATAVTVAEKNPNKVSNIVATAAAGALLLGLAAGNGLYQTSLEADGSVRADARPAVMAFGSLPVVVGAPAAVAFRLWRKKQDADDKAAKERTLAEKARETTMRKEERDKREKEAMAAEKVEREEREREKMKEKAKEKEREKEHDRLMKEKDTRAAPAPRMGDNAAGKKLK
jgi:flagellar biosynthesis GTPase FlhF